MGHSCAAAPVHFYAAVDNHHYTHHWMPLFVAEAAWKYNHHYTHHWMPLFVAEAAWKYNHRKTDNAFAAFIRGTVA